MTSWVFVLGDPAEPCAVTTVRLTVNRPENFGTATLSNAEMSRVVRLPWVSTIVYAHHHTAVAAAAQSLLAVGSSPDRWYEHV